MKKTIFGYLGAAALVLALQFTASQTQAGFFNIGPCDDLCTPCEDACDVGCGPTKGKWFVNGHLEAGFYANEYGRTCGTSCPGNSPLLMNTMHTGAQGNQIYVSGGKSVDGRRGLDIGGTIDATWGSDAWAVQTLGLDGDWGSGEYYGALAQAYIEAEYGRWNVKAGKFYAPFGSSSYTSPDNFFYSWAPSTFIVPPFTAGGVYATYTVNDKLSVMSGWVTPGEIGYSTKNNAGLLGVDWQATSRLNVFIACAYGNDGHIGADVFAHTLLTTYQLSKRLKYVFEWSYSEFNYGDKVDAYFGLNNEVVYCLNKNWSVGTRFGMVDFRAPNAGEWYNVGVGANWNPSSWLTVKSELRYDWTDNPGVRAFDRASSRDQFSAGMSAVVKF